MKMRVAVLLVIFLKVFLYAGEGFLSKEVSLFSDFFWDEISWLDFEDGMDKLKIEHLLETGQMHLLRELKLISNGAARVSPSSEQEGSYIDLPFEIRTKRASKWKAELDYVITDDCKKERFNQMKRVSQGQPT